MMTNHFKKKREERQKKELVHRLFKCADKLDELVEITIKQADSLTSWLRDAPKGANEN